MKNKGSHLTVLAIVLLVSSKTALASATTGQANTVRTAKKYLSVLAFSYDGLIGQLEYEGYSNSEAVYAADNSKANWNEQAAKRAKDYLEFQSFSRKELIAQLKYEGFTKSQAEFGAKENSP